MLLDSIPHLQPIDYRGSVEFFPSDTHNLKLTFLQTMTPEGFSGQF